LAAAALGVVAPASAFTDCPGFPQTSAAMGINHPRAGCSAGSIHKGTSNPGSVTATLVGNGSGAPRRALTVGLQGGTPIGPSCVAADTTVGGGTIVACPVRVDAIRMHLQL
jgi:hypothetical protein